MQLQSQDLRGKLSIILHGKEAAKDSAKEWFLHMSHEMTKSKYGLFEFTNKHRCSMQINPASGINPDDLTYFKFVGKVIAMVGWCAIVQKLGYSLH